MTDLAYTAMSDLVDAPSTTEPVLCRALTGRVHAPPGQTGPVVSILTFPRVDLAEDWVRPDGGDWTRFKAHPLVNWAHAIPVGRGVVEHKSLDFQGKSTVVAAGATEFFRVAADLAGIDRTEFDNPNDRTPVGEYSVDECLRAAEDAEALVRGNIATGVSIEFTPAGPKGSQPNEGAYWDLPGKSPLCPRPPRHFESWNGHAYAHARMPVNPGCRTVLDDQVEVIEKAIRVAQTGRLPGGKLVHHLVLKAFRDAETLLPLVRGEGRGSSVRGGWEGDVVEEMEAELEYKGSPDASELVSLVLGKWFHENGSPATRAMNSTMIRQIMQEHGVDQETASSALKEASGYAKAKWTKYSRDHLQDCPECGSLMRKDGACRTCEIGNTGKESKSFGDTDIFALDLTIPAMEVRAEDRSMFGPAATKAREASRLARNATADAGIPLKGAGQKTSLKDGAESLPPAGSLGGATLRAHGHAHDGNYQLAARSHGRTGSQLREMAETLPDDHPRKEKLYAAARAHEVAEDANLVAHSVVNTKTRMPGRPLIKPGEVGPSPRRLTYAGSSVGVDRAHTPKYTAVDSTSKHHEVLQAALDASQNAYHASRDRSHAESVGGHRELLTDAANASRSWNSDAGRVHHGALAEFHHEEADRLASIGDVAGEYAHREAAKLNRRAQQIHTQRAERTLPKEQPDAIRPTPTRPPVSAYHANATLNYKRPSLWQRMTQPTGIGWKAIPEPLPEDDVATQSDYAKIANTASRLAFKMSHGERNGHAEAKSVVDHIQAADTHRRHAKSLGEASRMGQAHDRAAEMHNRAAGYGPGGSHPDEVHEVHHNGSMVGAYSNVHEANAHAARLGGRTVEIKSARRSSLHAPFLKANDSDRTPAFASAGVEQPPAGVQALLNFAQLLVDGSTALGYDIQGSDDVDLRKYAKSLQVKAQDMAGELKALADKMAGRLKAADNGKGDTGPHPLAEGADQPDAEAKALDLRGDGSLVIKSYDQWTPRRFPLSALKTLPGGSNAVPTPAPAPTTEPAPVVKAEMTAEEKAKHAALLARVELELDKSIRLNKTLSEVAAAFQP